MDAPGPKPSRLTLALTLLNTIGILAVLAALVWAVLVKPWGKKSAGYPPTAHVPIPFPSDPSRPDTFPPPQPAPPPPPRTPDVHLLYFTATWCGPCVTQGPVVEEIAAQYRGKVSVMKIDVDENRDIAAQYKISGVPSLVIVKDGEVAELLLGYTDRATLQRALKRALR